MRPVLQVIFFKMESKKDCSWQKIKVGFVGIQDNGAANPRLLAGEGDRALEDSQPLLALPISPVPFTLALRIVDHATECPMGL